MHHKSNINRFHMGRDRIRHHLQIRHFFCFACWDCLPTPKANVELQHAVWRRTNDFLWGRKSHGFVWEDVDWGIRWYSLSKLGGFPYTRLVAWYCRQHRSRSSISRLVLHFWSWMIKGDKVEYYKLKFKARVLQCCVLLTNPFSLWTKKAAA